MTTPVDHTAADRLAAELEVAWAQRTGGVGLRAVSRQMATDGWTPQRLHAAADLADHAHAWNTGIARAAQNDWKPEASRTLMEVIADRLLFSLMTSLTSPARGNLSWREAFQWARVVAGAPYVSADKEMVMMACTTGLRRRSLPGRRGPVGIEEWPVRYGPLA